MEVEVEVVFVVEVGGKLVVIKGVLLGEMDTIRRTCFIGTEMISCVPNCVSQ